MKKISVLLVAAFIIAAFYIISCKEYVPAGSVPYLGEVEGLGSDDDANARFEYELMLLNDPATGKIPANIRERELAFAANLPNDLDLPAAKTTALGWDPRGPWNVGGRTRAVAIDVSNENNIVAGATSGGMWRSTDGGKTWHTTTPANMYKSVSCVVQDTRPGHTNVWYFGTGEAYGTSASGTGAFYTGDGVYKSTDSGKTWSLLPATTGHLTTSDVWGDIAWNIVIDPSDMANDVVYVASWGAIYRSANGGTTWASVLGGFGSAYFTDVAITKTGVVYATLSSETGIGGLFRSADGTTYTRINPVGFPTAYNRIKIGISPSDETQVYFLGNTPNSGMKYTNYVGQVEWNSLWRYTYLSGNGSDTGGRWHDRSMNLPNSGGVFDKFTCQGSYDLVVKVKPNDTNVVFIGGTNLYRSTTGFSDSTHTTYIGGYAHGASLPVVNMFLNHHPDQHEVVFYPTNPNKMISANDGGIFFTNDNTVPDVLWTSLNNGYITSTFYTCAIDHASTNDIVIGGAQDNGSWFTNSTSLTHPWVTPRGGDGSFCAIADYGKAYYFSIQNGKMTKAKVDNSGVVDSFARIDPKGGKGYLFINPYILDPNNNNLMYLAAGKFIWRNDDLSGIPYSSNWDSINTNWTRFPDSITSAGTITAIAVSTKPANRLYFGTNSKRVIRIDSANIGTHTMKNITANTLFPGGANVSCIAVDPDNADNVIVTYSNYGVNSIFYSSDGGTTWKKGGGNLEQNNLSGSGDGPSIRWATIIPLSDGKIYLVGTSVGLFAATALNDTNTVWVQQGANTIGASVVDMIDYRATDGLVVVATHSHGIFSSHITSVAGVTTVKQIPVNAGGSGFTNYPNPFTGETTIQFNLAERSNTTLNIYDGMGRLVRTVANEQMDAGEHKYLFATNNLPSGIYYCTLKAGMHTETRKIEIIR